MRGELLTAYVVCNGLRRARDMFMANVACIDLQLFMSCVCNIYSQEYAVNFF